MKPTAQFSRWSLVCLSLFATAFVAAGASPGAANNVPEAANYALVYSLEIPNGPDYAAGITYDVDLRSRFVAEPFTRVAYYLELQTKGGALSFWRPLLSGQLWLYASPPCRRATDSVCFQQLGRRAKES